MSTSSTPVQPRFQCRHVFISGHRCGSPALRQEHFCYYHHNTRKPAPHRHAAAGHRDAFALPNPEDRSAIQAAIGQVILRLAANELDPRRAGLLLYGLQIASLNLPPAKAPANPTETVEEVIEDPELGLIALPADFNTSPKRGKSLEDLLVEAWARHADEPPPPEPKHHSGYPANPHPDEPINIMASAGAPSFAVSSQRVGYRAKLDRTYAYRLAHESSVPHSSQSLRDEWVHHTPRTRSKSNKHHHQYSPHTPRSYTLTPIHELKSDDRRASRQVPLPDPRRSPRRRRHHGRYLPCLRNLCRRESIQADHQPRLPRRRLLLPALRLRRRLRL